MVAKLYAIAILGGTGQEGSGLALRWGKAGHWIILGSRDAAKAANAASEMKRTLGDAEITGADNKAAAAAVLGRVIPQLDHRPDVAGRIEDHVPSQAGDLTSPQASLGGKQDEHTVA